MVCCNADVLIAQELYNNNNNIIIIIVRIQGFGSQGSIIINTLVLEYVI